MAPFCIAPSSGRPAICAAVRPAAPAPVGTSK